MTIGILREQRAHLADLIAESFSAKLDGQAIDEHYYAELWNQLHKVNWLLGKKMELVV